MKVQQFDFLLTGLCPRQLQTPYTQRVMANLRGKGDTYVFIAFIFAFIFCVYHCVYFCVYHCVYNA